MKYYEAYEERYKTIHKKGHSWSSNVPTPIVLKTIKDLKLTKEDTILEIGCGEGRDSKPVLDEGYNLLATDISKEAIDYCATQMPEYAYNFWVLDCLNDKLDIKFDFIFAVAVIHMLVLDEDRKKFYQFIYDHLKDEGHALICSMGDGEMEMKSDISKAFEIVKREHESGDVMVASTSCRMVNFETFEKEIKEANLKVVDKGITSSLPDFDKLMFAIMTK